MCHEIEWVAVRSVESEKGRKDMHSTGSRVDGDYLEVHIDETGDWGTKPGSSPYFFMTACAFRASNLQVLETAMHDLNQVLGRPQGQEIHSIRHLKDHEKLIEASERLTTIKELRVLHRTALAREDAVVARAGRSDTGEQSAQLASASGRTRDERPDRLKPTLAAGYSGFPA